MIKPMITGLYLGTLMAAAAISLSTYTSKEYNLVFDRTEISCPFGGQKQVFAKPGTDLRPVDRRKGLSYLIEHDKVVYNLILSSAGLHIDSIQIRFINRL
jgi:hypothetical protein